MVNDPELQAISALRQLIALQEEPLTVYSPSECKAIREAHKLSRETAARAMGISVYSLQDHESGRHRPSPQQHAIWQRFTAALAATAPQKLEAQLVDRINDLLQAVA